MNHNPQAVRAGLFVVAAVAVAFTLLLMLGAAGRWFDPRPTRLVSFPVTVGVAGLAAGDPVRLGGVKIGTVSRVVVEPNPDEAGEALVRVEFELPSQFDLKRDADVRVGGTLTGLAWLEVHSLGEGEPLAKGEALNGKAGSYQALLTQVTELAPQISGAFSRVSGETIPRLNQALDAGTTLAQRIDGHVDPIAERVRDFAEEGGGAMAEAREVLGDGKVDIRATLANLRDTTDTINERLPTTIERVDSFLEEGHRLATNLNETSDNLKQVLDDTAAITADARSLVRGSRAKIERIVDSLQSAAIDAKLGLAEIRRSPWRLLHKPDQREQDLLDLYAAARQFSDGAREVTQAATALRDAARNPHVDEASLAELLHRLESQTDDFGRAQGLFWERVQAK